MRNISKVAPEWWDYTTLDKELLDEAAKLNEKDIQQLSRNGFTICFYDTIEEFYLAEALEYVTAWQQATKILRQESADQSARRSSFRLWRVL